MLSISIPLAAMSVAISTLIVPFLKSLIALVLAFCDLFPWIASEFISFLRRNAANLFALRLVLVKIKTLVRCSSFRSSINSFSFFLCQ